MVQICRLFQIPAILVADLQGGYKAHFLIGPRAVRLSLQTTVDIGELE